MIGNQPIGAIEGVVITAVAHEGLTVQIHGRPGRLAIIDEHGTVVASGPAVSREARNVSINTYRNFQIAQGHLRVVSNPIDPDPAANERSSAPRPRRA